MKTRFNNKELAHVWASQTQAEGQGSNMYFRNETIFSYGEHYLIAKFYGDLVLFNCKYYSPTTAKHKAYVKNAISNKKVIEVPFVEFKHKENLEYLNNQITERLSLVRNARKNIEDKITQYLESIDNYNHYIKAFKIKLKAVKSEITLKELKELRAKEEKNIIKENERARLLEEKQKEALELWAKGENVQNNFYGLPVRLRIKENIIQTSHGASASVEAGHVLYNMIKSGTNIEGYRIEHYTVNRLEEDTLFIGCHEIPMQEVNRIAEALKW